ncbi:MoaD/ThiS family protein [Okibacterium fritillariae]|uniref:Molybdopterin converting factor, small subunit n=1 Tax=Okibacterium fritillariae TaxID=123320 RepID=A0A1T5KDB4_9MICO|nr:MoaD/ThiS family protein [Okibacterium fritillariae]SKC61435.1 Molybdopterin converting factor, small subunit [Okibacterium fritillariae]
MTTRADASTTALRVTLRFFAAARAAVGRDTLDVELPAGSTIADALAAVTRQPAAPTSHDADAVAHAEAVFRRCSFLVNGVAVTDHARTLAADDRIDVMPPFAGG